MKYRNAMIIMFLAYAMLTGCSTRKLEKKDVIGKWVCSPRSKEEAAPRKWRDRYWLRFEKDGSVVGVVPKWMVDSDLQSAISMESQPQEAYVPYSAKGEWKIVEHVGKRYLEVWFKVGNKYTVQALYPKYKRKKLALYYGPSVEDPWIVIFFERVEEREGKKE